MIIIIIISIIICIIIEVKIIYDVKSNQMCKWRIVKVVFCVILWIDSPW